MGDVIEFRPAVTTARPRHPSTGAAGDCRILLFTGVRYERHPEAETESPATQPNGTKPRVGAKRRKKQA